ncbi:hypothetical protein Pla144_35790 [Bythopirellula polymerisocia]|uniref:Uncharacterized protein n=1 Tax=Bythopirellula polymerisocia TaxID=2528003 RepID=A0A5C6CIT8_9BACT|nr:hypothetical protein Pla144_35790 [Bythopirellula polymerisocia]
MCIFPFQSISLLLVIKMGSYLAFPNPLLWMLIVLQTGAPLPWFHRHCDLREGEMQSHLNACHKSSQEKASPEWHLHVLSQKFSFAEDGFNTQLPLRKVHQFPSNQISFAEEIRRMILDRVQHLGQLAIHFSGHVVDVECDLSPIDAGSTICKVVRASLVRCVIFCVRQI